MSRTRSSSSANLLLMDTNSSTLSSPSASSATSSSALVKVDTGSRSCEHGGVFILPEFEDSGDLIIMPGGNSFLDATVERAVAYGGPDFTDRATSSRALRSRSVYALHADWTRFSVNVCDKLTADNVRDVEVFKPFYEELNGLEDGDDKLETPLDVGRSWGTDGRRIRRGQAAYIAGIITAPIIVIYVVGEDLYREIIQPLPVRIEYCIAPDNLRAPGRPVALLFDIGTKHYSAYPHEVGLTHVLERCDLLISASLLGSAPSAGAVAVGDRRSVRRSPASGWPSSFSRDESGLEAGEKGQGEAQMEPSSGPERSKSTAGKVKEKSGQKDWAVIASHIWPHLHTLICTNAKGEIALDMVKIRAELIAKGLIEKTVQPGYLNKWLTAGFKRAYGNKFMDTARDAAGGPVPGSSRNDYKGLAQVLAQRRAEFQVSTYGSTKIDWDLVVDTFVDEGRCEPRMTMIFKRAILRACSDEQAALLVSA